MSLAASSRSGTRRATSVMRATLARHTATSFCWTVSPDARPRHGVDEGRLFPLEDRVEDLGLAAGEVVIETALHHAEASSELGGRGPTEPSVRMRSRASSRMRSRVSLIGPPLAP